MARKEKWTLPVVYANRRVHRHLIEVLYTVEEYMGYTVVYLWFHFPYDWWFKPYDWEPVAIAFEKNHPVRIFWRPHWLLKSSAPVLMDKQTVVFYISPARGNAPRCSHADVLWSMLTDPYTYGIPFKRFRKLPLTRLMREGWPPEEQATAESFKRFVNEGLKHIKTPGPINRLMGFLTNLLRAYIMLRRKNLEGLYYYLRKAWEQSSQKFKRSGGGYEMFTLLTSVKYLLMFQKAGGKPPITEFWKETDGLQLLPTPFKALTSSVFYPVMLLIADGYRPAQPFTELVDRRGREWLRKALQDMKN